MKKIAGDMIILHKCTKNHNHMRYGSWDMLWDRQNFFCHFGPIFALLSPNNPENQNFDKMKKHLEMSSFYTCASYMIVI